MEIKGVGVSLCSKEFLGGGGGGKNEAFHRILLAKKFIPLNELIFVITKFRKVDISTISTSYLFPLENYYPLRSRPV